MFLENQECCRHELPKPRESGTVSTFVREVNQGRGASTKHVFLVRTTSARMTDASDLRQRCCKY